MANTINTRIVLRHDTHEGWEAVKDNLDKALLAGEMGIEDDTGLFKIGKKHDTEDRLCTWAELEYANEIPDVDLSTVTNNVKEAATFEGLGKGAVVGDIGIVKAIIYQEEKKDDEGNVEKDEEGNTIYINQKYSYTAYVWTYLGKDNEGNDVYGWSAMDGNYSAENVFLSQAITLAGDYGTADGKAVEFLGNYRKGDVISAGTSINDVFKKLFTKSLQPSKSNPSLTISASGSDGDKEVGDTYTKPTAKLTVNGGSYTYGYKDSNGNKQTGTGVTFPTAKLAFGADDTITTEGQYVTGSNLNPGGQISLAASTYAKDNTTATYTDSQVSYTFSANASHTAGGVAIDNLDELSKPVVQIGANDYLTVDDKTVKYRGYRKMFFGHTTNTNLNSSVIRALEFKKTSDGKTYNGVKASTTEYGITLPAGAKNLVIACPTAGVGKEYKLSKVQMFSAGVWDTYTAKFDPDNPKSVSVDGKVAGQNAQNYNVYIWEFAALGGDTDFKITLK